MMITSEVKICLVRIAALRRHGGGGIISVRSILWLEKVEKKTDGIELGPKFNGSCKT